MLTSTSRLRKTCAIFLASRSFVVANGSPNFLAAPACSAIQKHTTKATRHFIVSPTAL